MLKLWAACIIVFATTCTSLAPSKPKNCNPCAKTLCKKSFVCVADKYTCQARCEHNCRHCRHKPNPCKDVSCGPNKFCKTQCYRCGHSCVSKTNCRGNPCRGGLCGNNERCVPNFKDCTHTCKKCLFACPLIYAPVCGSDGKTYANECVLRSAACSSKTRLIKKKDGRCDCRRPCTREFRPICGSDGRTYSNPCVFKIAVCESNGKLTKKNDGRCKKTCPEICPLNFAPVCGSDGKTYPNACALGVASCKSGGRIKQVSEGSCPKSCRRPCTREFRPICGSDGRTYANPCLFKIAVCESNGKLTKKNDGPCKCRPENPCSVVRCKSGTECIANLRTCRAQCVPCTPCKKLTCKQNEVCVANKQQCTARCECTPCKTMQCQPGYRCVTNLSTCKGTCDKPCNKPCPEIFAPVCGTDDVQYDNECFLNNAICLSAMEGGKLKKKNDGPCKKECPITPCAFTTCIVGSQCVPDFTTCTAKCVTKKCEKTCSKELNQICGSDGVTYANPCLFEIAVCKSNGKLTKKNDGPCCVKNCRKDLLCSTILCPSGTVPTPDECACTCECKKCQICRRTCAGLFTCTVNPQTCQEKCECKTNPCAATLCLANSQCVPDFKTCTAKCVPLVTLPTPKPKCNPCKCRNCGINGRCVADTKDCTSVCAKRCPPFNPPVLCLVAPCTFNKCKKDEICVPGCAPCSSVCLKKQPQFNPCALVRCAAGFECKLEGCTANCVAKKPKVLPRCKTRPDSGNLICGQAFTVFCKKDCKTCCLSPNTCGPIGYVNGRTCGVNFEI